MKNKDNKLPDNYYTEKLAKQELRRRKVLQIRNIILLIIISFMILLFLIAYKLGSTR